jgi:hypothetical protein
MPQRQVALADTLRAFSSDSLLFSTFTGTGERRTVRSTHVIRQQGPTNKCRQHRPFSATTAITFRHGRPVNKIRQHRPIYFPKLSLFIVPPHANDRALRWRFFISNCANVNGGCRWSGITLARVGRGYARIRCGSDAEPTSSVLSGAYYARRTAHAREAAPYSICGGCGRSSVAVGSAVVAVRPSP